MNTSAAKADRVAELLDGILGESHSPQRLLDQIVNKCSAHGLDWREIVRAVEEAERRTGLSLQPAGTR